MKTKIITILLSLSTALLSLGADVKQALAVEVPATWELKYKGEKRMQFYTATRKDGDSALLMFSRSPVPGNVAEIPEQIDELAKGFVSLVEKNKDLKLESTKYTVEKIEGVLFSGSFVQFSIKGGIVQTMFMIGDNEGIWTGQFTGTKERWAEALEILKKLKKNG